MYQNAIRKAILNSEIQYVFDEYILIEPKEALHINPTFPVHIPKPQTTSAPQHNDP